MKNIILFSFLLIIPLYLSAQAEECICMEKVYGEDTIKVYSNTDNPLVPCRFPTKILLTHNGKQYTIWTNTDSLFIERHSTIKELCYDSNSKTLSLIYYSHRYSRRYMPSWVRFMCGGHNNTLIWTPTCYYLPVKETDIAHDKTYLVNTDLVVSYYRSLSQPIVYIINRVGELIEYRDGKAVDKNTVPYRTPFKPHIPTPTSPPKKT